MKPKVLIRTNWKKWKTLLGRAKKRPKASTKKSTNDAEEMEGASAENGARQQRATNSAPIADRKIVVAVAVAAEGGPCADSRGTNQRGRCLPLVIC